MKQHISKTMDEAVNRGGVTLTEVLMSLMIMSIGVASVATLFPIAALRSAQATKMTNGAIVKYNVEALIKARPELVFDPDGDFLASTATSPSYWRRMTEHFRGGGEKNYIIDPSGYMNAASGGSFGPVTSSVSGNTIDVNAVPAGTTRGFADFFGNTAANTAYTVLPRYDGGLRAAARVSGVQLNATTLRDFELLASELGSLGDTWDTVVDEVCEGFIDTNGSFSASPTSNIVGVRLSGDFDLSSLVTSQQYAGILSIPDPELTRITVFSVDGRMSQTYPLTAISGQDCVWTEAAVGPIPATDYNNDLVRSVRTLPIEFSVVPPGVPLDPTLLAVGRVLIQTKRTEDFTWMLTVRRGPDGRAAGVDVVVLFTAARKPEAERAFPANFINGSFGLLVNKTSGTTATGDPAEPKLKRGGWVLDVENARWYRISNYEEANATQMLVTLDTAAVASSPGGVGGAVFLPGVVDVYPLGSVSLPDTMKPQNF